MSETLYDRLAADGGIEPVVDDFYDRVLADEALVAYFDDTDMDELRDHQRDFLAMVTGGPTEYDGADMRTAHAHLSLDGNDFAAIAGHLDRALEANGVAEADREAVLEAVVGYQDEILNR